MVISREMINQAKVKMSEGKSSTDFEELPFYKEIMRLIGKEYSNDDIEALQWILSELGRNVEYVTIRSRLSKEYNARVELTKDDRRNNIKVSVSEVYYLRLSKNERKFKGSSQVYRAGFREPFYVGNKDMIKNIFENFEKLANEFNIANKVECLEKIEEYTKCMVSDFS